MIYSDDYNIFFLYYFLSITFCLLLFVYYFLSTSSAVWSPGLYIGIMQNTPSPHFTYPRFLCPFAFTHKPSQQTNAVCLTNKQTAFT